MGVKLTDCQVYIMNYSDSVKAILLTTIDELAACPEKYAQGPGRDFTRKSIQSTDIGTL